MSPEPRGLRPNRSQPRKNAENAKREKSTDEAYVRDRTGVQRLGMRPPSLISFAFLVFFCGVPIAGFQADYSALRLVRRTAIGRRKKSSRFCLPWPR